MRRSPRSRTPIEEKAYWLWYEQRRRAGVEYTREEFISWYVREYRKKRKWKCANVARYNHSKPYSFCNISLQEKSENSRERNTRCGNPGYKLSKPVFSYCPTNGKERYFTSACEAARFFGVNRKTVWNHCAGRSKSTGKFGPRKYQHGVKFRWAK